MSDGRRTSKQARRAVLRWAWRMFSREWRQQLLVLGLVTVAVGASVAGATMLTNSAGSAQPQFGAGNALINVDGVNDSHARSTIATARRRFGPVEVIGHTQVPVPGSATPLDLRAQDPAGQFGHPLIALRSGRYPVAPDEMALTESVEALLSVRTGVAIDLGGVTRTVVGQVENPSDLEDSFALVMADESAPATSFTLLTETPDSGHGVQTPGDDDASGTEQIDLPIMARGDNGPVGALVLVGVTIAMILVGLIATAGFVVVAHRRQRQLGLLAAIGATERHLRLVMVADGAIVGAIAAVLGAALGIAGWITAAPAIETGVGRRIDRLDLPWALIAGCMALALVMSATAAWWPARGLSRLPVMTALSGRPSRPLPVHRSSLVALVLLGLGIWGIWSANTFGKVRPWLLIFGLIGVVGGVVFVSPAAIRALALPARRSPFAARLALRDLVRYQARAASALAAITLALGISVSVIVAAQANQYRAWEGNLSSHQLLVRVADQRSTDDHLASAADPRLTAAQVAQLDAKATRVAAAIPEATTLPLDVAMHDTGGKGLSEPIGEGTAVDDVSFEMIDHPAIATPEVLARFGIDPASIRPETDLLTRRRDDVLLLDVANVGVDPSAKVAKSTPPPTPQQWVDLPAYESAPTALITQGAMQRHGWLPARSSWLIESPEELTAQQIAAARAAAADAGMTIETRSTQDDLATLRKVATIAGAALALAIVAMTVGLIRSEAARDLRTLTANGATARTRRALTSTTAGALAMLGVLLGTAGAYIGLIAAYHSKLTQLTPLPVTQLLILGLGLPLAAAGAGWLLAGHEPRTFSRQTFD